MPSSALTSTLDSRRTRSNGTTRSGSPGTAPIPVEESVVESVVAAGEVDDGVGEAGPEVDGPGAEGADAEPDGAHAEVGIDPDEGA